MNSFQDMTAFAVPSTAEDLEVGRTRSHQLTLLNPSLVPGCAGPELVGGGSGSTEDRGCDGHGRGSPPFLNSSVPSS